MRKGFAHFGKAVQGGKRMINGLGGSAIFNTLNRSNKSLSKAMEKLSTGSKINQASDDPAGLVISSQMRAQIAGTQRAIQNTQEANSMLSIAEGGLASISKPLAKAKQLALASANSGVTTEEQTRANQAEMNNILSSIQNIASTTSYSGRSLLNGASANLHLQLGESAGGADSFSLPNISLESLGKISIEEEVTDPDTGAVSTVRNEYSMADLFAGGRAALAEKPEIAAQVVDQAVKDIAGMRAEIGAYQANTLDSNANSLEVALANIYATESAISDTDIAKAVTEQTTASIKTQAGLLGVQKLNKSAGQYLKLLGIEQQ